jgi:hypothetical protein
MTSFPSRLERSSGCPRRSCVWVSAAGAHPSPPLARVFGSGCRTLRRANLRTPYHRCVAPTFWCRAARSRRGHLKSVLLSSRPSSSCRPAPKCEGQVVVGIPQPPNARAEFANQFLQKQNQRIAVCGMTTTNSEKTALDGAQRDLQFQLF